MRRDAKKNEKKMLQDLFECIIFCQCRLQSVQCCVFFFIFIASTAARFSYVDERVARHFEFYEAVQNIKKATKSYDEDLI